MELKRVGEGNGYGTVGREGLGGEKEGGLEVVGGGPWGRWKIVGGVDKWGE